MNVYFDIWSHQETILKVQEKSVQEGLSLRSY